MLGRRRSEFDGPTSRLTAIRDVVEIVAIVAAGIWAFYTFVYENQIKPANGKPDAQVETTLARLGERHGLSAIGLRIVVKNVGTTDVWLYGIAATVVGSTVRARARPDVVSAPRGAFEETYDGGWTESRPTRVFASALLTNLGDPRSDNSDDLRPDQTVTFDHIFYVAAGRFDRLRTFVSMHFAARATPIPFRLGTDGDGIVHVDPAGPESTDNLDSWTSALSLWR